MSFLSHVRLGCHQTFSKQCLLAASNCNLAFYKTRQLATWLQVSPKCQVQTEFPAYSYEKKWDFFCLSEFHLSLLWLLLVRSDTPKWKTKGWRWSRTWNSGILPIQGLVSKLRLPYAPFWQKVIRVIVPQFHKLKLSRTLRGSGVQILSVFPVSCFRV